MSTRCNNGDLLAQEALFVAEWDEAELVFARSTL